MNSGRRRQLAVFFWMAALIWAAVLFFFSGQTAADSGNLSMRVTRFLLRLFPLPVSAEQFNPILRKIAHFCIFGMEGFLLGGALMCTLRRKWQGTLLATGVCSLVAALNEYHQTFSAGRSCELRDVLIDTAGAVAGIVVMRLLLHAAERMRRNVIIS